MRLALLIKGCGLVNAGVFGCFPGLKQPFLGVISRAHLLYP